MNILNTEQIRVWDAYTIAHEPISPKSLMERAATTFTEWFAQRYDNQKTIIIYCGTGNNGGDGLAIARQLHYSFYEVHVYICPLSTHESDDFKKNLEQLPHRAEILGGYIRNGDPYPTPPQGAVIIDAILGSGVSRPVEGYWAGFFNHLSKCDNEIIAVDMPSGLYADAQTDGAVVKATMVATFETPKLALFMPENQDFLDNFKVLPIGLHRDFLTETTPYNIYVTQAYVTPLLRKRRKFDHKGTHGHALLVVGNFGMAGAAVLSAKACMRSGVGVLTVQSPQCNRIIVQSVVPEALFRADADEYAISQNTETEIYDTIGIGCGLGKAGRTAAALRNYLTQFRKPMIIDADALNLIADNPDMLSLIPKNSILTPHPKEFERLFGKTYDDFSRVELLRNKAKSLKINILLKGAHTIVANTEGVCFFNSTGNAGMATAGSGDVLTGIITSLVAQGYVPYQAAVIGVYLHGLAGDLAAQETGEMALMAGDIVEYLGKAIMEIESKKL
jgi:ADP-dependent NAD(P)H-hydrate dehydratase / NAD(P)H-hydrate epimerase